MAYGWVYDDGLVVWVASADESLGKIRSEFGCGCVAVLRYEPLGEAVVVLEGEPDMLVDRTSECLTDDPNGLIGTDCRSASMERKLFQAMGIEYPWFRVDCRVPRPAVKDQVVQIDAGFVLAARRVVAEMYDSVVDTD